MTTETVVMREMVCAQWDRSGRLRVGDTSNPQHLYSRSEWYAHIAMNPNEETWLSDEVSGDSLIVSVPCRSEIETVRCRIF